MTADNYARASLNRAPKARATERRMPFEIKAPSSGTRKAITELEAGKGKNFASVAELMADLRAPNPRNP